MDFIDYDLDYNYNNNVQASGSSSSSSSSHNGLHSASPSTSSSSDFLTSYRCVLLNYPVNSTNSLVSYYSLWLTNSNPLYPPTDFTPVHHVAYHVSQLFLLVYVVVCRGVNGGGGGSGGISSSGSSSTSGNVLPLIVLLSYTIVQLLWGLLIMKSADVCGWNALHGVVIMVRIVMSCCCGDKSSSIGKSPSSRRIKAERAGKGIIVSPTSIAVCGGGGPGNNNGASNGSAAKVRSEIDVVYNRLFAPVRVSYKQFMRVVGCKRGFKALACGENYAVEKRTRVDSLGLLVAGRLVVSQAGKPLHVILPFQFVDSPEYFGVATGSRAL